MRERRVGDLLQRLQDKHSELPLSLRLEVVEALAQLLVIDLREHPRLSAADTVVPPPGSARATAAAADIRNRMPEDDQLVTPPAWRRRRPDIDD